MDQQIAGTQTQFDVGGVMLERPFKILRLGHFGFNMPSADDGLAFYAGLLGMRLMDVLDFPSVAPDPSKFEGLTHTKGYFLNHGTDHHSFVIFPQEAINAVGRKPDRDDMFVNQMSWQVGSLQEVRDALDWFSAMGNKINRIGRDMPGSNWHSYPFDPEGNINELYYGMEQIGWNLRAKPRSLYHRGFRERPDLPQISEYEEIGDAEEQGIDLLSGSRIIEDRPFKYQVGGVMLSRPFKINKVGPARLWVDDMEKELAFYTGLFGLTLTEEIEYMGERCVFLRANTEHHSLALYPETLRAKLGLKADSTCFSFGFRLGSYRQLKDAVAWLKDEGAEIRYLPPELFPGMDYTAFVTDPQGHSIQLYAYMEQVGWDGRPRPSEARRKVKEGADWPETLAPMQDDYAGEVYLGPLA
jgi:catechol 2,3-dioxygenase-like lactoylglutathione lyase family enzyme